MKINLFKILNTGSNARKNRALLLIFFFSAITAQAQDSIFVSSHLTDLQVKNQIFAYPIVYTNSYIKDFTFTELSYEHRQNEFARTQTANEINTFQFLAQGYFTTKSKWKLFGDLSIRKKEEKNLGWILSDDRTEEQEVLMPHYFFVPRKGDWTSQQYDINGGISKEITSKISLAAKASFNAGKYSRNVDPRPQIISRKLMGELQLGYQLAERHKIFVFANYATTDKDYSYIYKDKHLNFESNPDTYLRFNTGYGRIVNYFKSNYNNTTRFLYKDITTKTGLGYTFSTKNSNFTALYYNQKSNNDFYTSVFGTEDQARFKYETTTNHAELFVLYKWNQKELKSTFKYDSSTSINYDVQSKGHNYKSALNTINWLTSISKKTNTKIDYLYGLNVNYQQNNYNDILATSNMDINSVNTGIFGSKDFAFTTSKINATVNFNMYFALPSKLDYYDTSGGTNTTFFNEVIIHDYAVSTTNYFSPGLRLEYSYPVKNNKTVVFFTNFKEKIALKKQNDYNAIINTNTTYWIQCGVQLNY